MKLEIRLREGLTGLPFHSSTEPVRDIFGSPDEMEELDNPCDGSLESIVWNYNNHGLNFFFDVTGDEPVLCTIESDNIETMLFGKKLFQLPQADIKALMLANGFSDPEEEDENWGEHRITFEEAQIDFYFTDGELTLVSWSCF